MKKTLFSLPEHAPLHAITTLCIGLGSAYPLSLALGLVAPLPLFAACCALVTLLFFLFDCVPRLRALAYPALFALLFGALLALAVAVLAQHRQAAAGQPLPLVALSRLLGKGGYFLCAGAMYAAALSTLCAMLAALLRLLPGPRTVRALAACALCALFALVGFGRLVSSAYPVLGSLCAALLLLLCLPGGQKASSSSR